MKTLSQLCALIGLTIVCNVWGVPRVATLDDGRQVVLNDDFTWQYVAPFDDRKQSSTEAKPVPVANTVAVSVVAAPVMTKGQGVHFVPGANKNIQQLSRSGVDVLLRSATYRDGELVIPTLQTNQGSESVILVSLKVTIRDEQGRELVSKQDKIWNSVKRMPETYFRPNTQRRGKPIKISVSEAKSYYIEAEIVEVEHW